MSHPQDCMCHLCLPGSESSPSKTPMTPTAELIERLRAYAKYRPVPTAQTSHSLAEAADRLAEQEKENESLKTRIHELEALPETDYLHLAMEQKKRIAELEQDSKIVDWIATFWDSQSTATQSILGAEYTNPTGSFRDAILSAIEQGQAGA